MAIHLPSNLYAGEAERFNMMPHVQFSTQLLAQRKAKDEAIDNYYKDLPNTINDKGVRDRDIPAIAGVKTQIQEYWSKNKDAIRKGNTPEALALQKMYRDANYLVRESQNAAQVDLELGKRRFQGGSEHIFTNPDFMQQQQLHDLPVGDPNRTPIDLAHITLPPKPFEVGALLKKYSDIKPDEGMPQIQAHPTDKYYNIEVTPKAFGKEAKTAVYERAATDYENDPSFKNHIDNTLAKNPQQLKWLSELFTKEYGHPIENEHDLAAAYMLSVIPKGEVKQKLIDSGLRAKEEWNRRNAITSRQSMERIIANRGLYTPDYNPTTGNSLDEFPDVEIQNGKRIVNGAVFNDDGTPYSSKPGNADIYVVKEKVPANLIASLKAAGIGDIGAGVNIEVKDGIVIGVQTKRNGYVSRLAVENAQKKFNTEPLKGTQPQFGRTINTQPAPAKSKPTQAKKDPLGIL